MAAKKEAKATKAKAKKPIEKSSMAFIREKVEANPDISFDALMKAVVKGGYKTKQVSVHQEHRKVLRKLKAENCGLPESEEVS